jgi:hypothetical protein
VQDLASVESVSARLETVLIRLSARFRSMPESKLLGRLPDGRSRAAAGHELAGLVALAAQGVEDRDRRKPPAWRALPFDGPFVVGDQIGVTGHDLLVASAVAISGDGAGDGDMDRDGDTDEDGGLSTVWVRGGGGDDRCCARAGVGELLGTVLGEAEELARII